MKPLSGSQIPRLGSMASGVPPPPPPPKSFSIFDDNFKKLESFRVKGKQLYTAAPSAPYPVPPPNPFDPPNPFIPPKDPFVFGGNFGFNSNGPRAVMRRDYKYRP